MQSRPCTVLGLTGLFFSLCLLFNLRFVIQGSYKPPD